LGKPKLPDQYVCRFSFSDCGGGLYVYLSQIHLRNGLITKNTASQDDGLGGGIFLWNVGRGIIENTAV